MTEKVKCKNEHCTAMILPRTAEETGGFCMPCAGKQVTPNAIKKYMDQSFAYEHFSVENQLHIVCLHCRGPVVLFENLDPKVKREIARCRYNGEFAKAMTTLRQETGFDLRQAKLTMFHLRTIEGYCHNCGQQLVRGSLICPRCMTVNLDW